MTEKRVKLHRTKLVLRCKDCGTRYTVNTDKPMVCPECKNDKWYCHNCHEYFEPKEFCLRCRWFICPKCGACGCDYKGPRHRRYSAGVSTSVVTRSFKELGGGFHFRVLGVPS